ncbi:MAG: class I SAM-dependent methyltransferase [Halopenitus sp.]
MDDPGEFFDPLAPLYDAHVADDQGESLNDDVVFYRDLASEVSGPALELGVGTGRIYLELLDAGIDADGIDLSEEMISVLWETAADRNLNPSVRVGDVTDFDAERQYELIYAPNRMFNHLATVSDQRKALQNIHRALAPGGKFVLNTFVPRFETVVETYGDPMEDVTVVGDDTYRVVVTPSLEDEVEQLARLHRELFRNGELIAERDTPLALIPKRQFELLFELAGFDSWQVYGGFDRAPLESSDQEMVWMVQK